MRAIVLHEFGGPEVMRVEEIEAPTPGAGEVVVEVHSVSVNRALDIQVRKDGGNYGVQLPLILGTDSSGFVVEVGPGVETPKLGERVTVHPNFACGRCANCREGKPCRQPKMIGVHCWGGYAERILAPAENCITVPEAVPFPTASVLARHYPTALSELRRANIEPGETALVMGAAGALGSCVVQALRLAGVRVIAAAGTDDRLQAALSLGAEFGINYGQERLSEEVKRATDGRGVDVVFENIGAPDLWAEAFACLAREGRLVTAGAHGGGVVTLDVRRLYQDRLSVIGGIGLELKEDVALALELAAAGQICALVDRVLPLSEAPLAHELVDANQTVGKVVLDPSLS
ncbi:MAG TPA: zinc-binding dehydrogenase [Dehalococcoidia bacterium]|nr:zinc-binding dehydrogenase [Dehalococcoidia bacterium]